MLKAVIEKGWPEHKSNVSGIISPYFNMWDEMSIQDGLIFKENVSWFHERRAASCYDESTVHILR